MGQSHFPHPSKNSRDKKLKGQVFYRVPWGNRTFRTHPVRSSGSVARRLTLSSDLSAPPTNRSTRIPPAGRTFTRRHRALSRSRRHGRDLSKDSQQSPPAALNPGRLLRPGGSPITSFLRSRKTQSPSHSASRMGRAPVVRFGPNRSR